MPVTIQDGMTVANLPMRMRLGRQQQERLVTLVREASRVSDERRSRLHSRAGVLAYQTSVRAKLEACFGPWPTAGALNAQVTGTLVRAGYRVEKLVFESMPGWFVSANLYIPDTATAQSPAPAVVGFCGHTDNGKASDSYQRFSQGLAKLGYVCLTIDAIGHGERRQIPASATSEHRALGNQLPLVGWSLAGMQVWDGMRAVDYLLSRPEVNGAHIGTTGNSGGGTQAAWLAALDSRVTMAAPSCFVTTFAANLENELWADHEQTPPRVLEFGLEMVDILACVAPRPLCLIGQARDYFDSRGLREVWRKLQHVYELHDASDNLRLYVGPGAHSFAVDGRREMYRWFNRATAGNDAAVTEPATALETEQDLWVTGAGSVLELSGSLSSYDWMRAKADELSSARGEPEGDELRERVLSVLRLPADRDTTPPHYRVWAQYYNWTHGGHSLSPPPTPPNWPQSYGAVYAVETEPGIIAPLYRVSNGSDYHHPILEKPAGTRAILYVAHESADRELSKATREPALAAAIAAEPSAALFAIDPRGVGETAPHCTASYNGVFHEQHLEMLGTPLLGRQVWDLLRCCDLLAAHGYTDIYLIGRGYGSPAAALCAYLHPAVTQVKLKNGLTRWTACARAEPEQMAWPHGVLPSGALTQFDLNDVYMALDEKGFANEAPWGAWLANPNGEF